jgi:uncharacterized protein (TIGR01370 family)
MRKLKPRPASWLCYYGLEAPLEAYGRFDLVVFDSTWHPDLVRREDGGPVLLGYLSAAEVLENGPHWARAGEGTLIRKKPEWNSWVLDLRDPDWRAFLVREAVPSILEQGFDGILLDTLDSALALELWTDPDRYCGTREAAVRLVEDLRRARPDMVIAVNRALPVLGEIALCLDLLVLEGLSSIYGGPEAGYVPVEPEERRRLLDWLEAGLAKRPRLPVLTLDYAPEDRPDLVQEALGRALRKGFVPYVSTLELDRIYAHTLDDGPAPCGGARGSGGGAG